MARRRPETADEPFDNPARNSIYRRLLSEGQTPAEAHTKAAKYRTAWERVRAQPGYFFGIDP
jgi:hypothetical protein